MQYPQVYLHCNYVLLSDLCTDTLHYGCASITYSEKITAFIGLQIRVFESCFSSDADKPALSFFDE